MKKALILAIVFSVFFALPAFAVTHYGQQLAIYDGHKARIPSTHYGNTFLHDSNHSVPEYMNGQKAAGGFARTFPGTRCGSGPCGTTNTTIYYDPALMRKYAATGCGWDSVGRHERWHANGWHHHEGNPPNGNGTIGPGENPAYHAQATNKQIGCHYPADASENYANAF